METKIYGEKIEQVSRYCAKRISKNLTEAQIVAIINKLKTASPRVAMRFLTEKAMNVYNNYSSKEFTLMLNQIYKLNDGTYPNAKAIVEEIQKEKDLNLPEQGQTLEENHKTLKSSLKLVCDKFNDLGIDYYIVGALPVYLSQEKLIRYHDDIDFMVAEKDLAKVAKALEGTSFEFKDHRLDSPKVVDENGNLTNGEHEVLATRSDNEFHLGFFLFKREDEKVTVREYHAKLDENGKKVPLLQTREKSLEVFNSEYNDEYVECYGTKFRCSTPESVYGIKRYTQNQPGRHKDKIDADTWQSWGMIDEHKIQEINRLHEKYPEMEGSKRKELPQKLIDQILAQQGEIKNVQQGIARGLQIEQ